MRTLWRSRCSQVDHGGGRDAGKKNYQDVAKTQYPEEASPFEAFLVSKAFNHIQENTFKVSTHAMANFGKRPSVRKQLAREPKIQNEGRKARGQWQNRKPRL